MGHLKRWRKLPLMQIALFISLSLLGQNADRSENPSYDLKIPVELVLVPVTVEDRDGNLIRGLQKKDFEVYEDGVTQKVSYFSVDPLPLSVALLIDKTIDDRTQEIFREDMLALVEAFSGFDELALYEFSDEAKRIQDFSVRKEDLLKPMNQVEFGHVLGPGLPLLDYAPVIYASHLDSAIMAAVYDLQRRPKSRRKIIFVVSNGVVAASDRQSYPTTKRYLLNHSITVYGIGQGNSFLFRKVDPLKKYAEPTGGEVFYPIKRKAFSEAYQKISETARNQYILGYVPQVKGKAPGYRRIRVRVTRKGFVGNVRSRQGYYAGPQGT